jgi:hypothetical protein
VNRDPVTRGWWCWFGIAGVKFFNGAHRRIAAIWLWASVVVATFRIWFSVIAAIWLRASGIVAVFRLWVPCVIPALCLWLSGVATLCWWVSVVIPALLLRASGIIALAGIAGRGTSGRALAMLGLETGFGAVFHGCNKG